MNLWIEKSGSREYSPLMEIVSGKNVKKICYAFSVDYLVLAETAGIYNSLANGYFIIFICILSDA